MRKQPKSFTVEVKRRPSSLTKKPALVEPAAPTPQPPAAAAVFSTPESAGAAADPRRILPCLVTEAAMDAAKTVEDADLSLEPRRRGRPRKQKGPDDPAPLAPRKRGRPRKNPVTIVQLVPEPVRPPAPRPAMQVARSTPVAAVGASLRSSARRDAVSELPRGERWKRRLPKALR